MAGSLYGKNVSRYRTRISSRRAPYGKRLSRILSGSWERDRLPRNHTFYKNLGLETHAYPGSFACSPCVGPLPLPISVIAARVFSRETPRAPTENRPNSHHPRSIHKYPRWFRPPLSPNGIRFDFIAFLRDLRGLFFYFLLPPIMRNSSRNRLMKSR